MASTSGGAGNGALGMGAEDAAEIEMIRKSPAFWAKLGHHPYWPAKSATKEERQRYSSYQRKATQICVKFYGSNDIGWIAPTSLVGFDEGMRKNFHATAKLAKNAKFLAGVEQASRIMDEVHGSSHGLYYPSSPMLGADGSGDESGGVGAQANGGSLRPAPLSPTPEDGAGDAPAAAKRGRGRPPRNGAASEGSMTAAAAEARKRRASLALAAAAERRARWGHQGLPHGGEEGEDDGGAWGDDHDSECFVCKEPGMLIVCDAPSCRKAYHKPCLGLTAWGDAFYCPRHRCVVCRALEAELATAAAKQKGAEGASGSGSTNGGAAAASSSSEAEEEPAAQRKGKGRPSSSSSQAQGAGQRGGLWKCAECPVSYCPEHLPPGINYSRPGSGAVGGSEGAEEGGQPVRARQQRLCGHCKTPSPRVQLASILERSWARLATNYLALPFMRPFLHGAAVSVSVSASASEDGLLDLVEVALRIRGLRYATAEEYLGDLGALLEQARRVAGDGEEAAPVREAMETLLGNAERFLDAVRKEVVPAEALIQEEEAGGGSSSKAAGVAAGAVAWRAELVGTEGEEQEALRKAPGGAFKAEYCPARTLEEWSDYLAKAPMLHVDSQQPLANNGGAEGDDGGERGAIARVLAQMRFEDGYPHKSTLLHRDHLEAALDQQATLLRRCLEGHAQLRRSLQEEKAVVLEFSASHARKRRRLEQQQQQQQGDDSMAADGVEAVAAAAAVEGEEEGEFDDDSHVVTLGDMHILKELQMANQNLRARLESKDSLLRQREAQLEAARAAFLDLQAQNARLKEQLQQQQQQQQQQEEEGVSASASASATAAAPAAQEEEGEGEEERQEAAAPVAAPQPSPPEGTEEAKGKEEASADAQAEAEAEGHVTGSGGAGMPEEAEMEVDVDPEDQDMDDTDRAETSSTAASSTPSPGAAAREAGGGGGSTKPPAAEGPAAVEAPAVGVEKPPAVEGGPLPSS